MSKDFFSRNRELFQVEDTPTILSHSNRETEEEAGLLILNGKLKLGELTYWSNFVVGEYRYDVMMGMP